MKKSEPEESTPEEDFRKAMAIVRFNQGPEGIARLNEASVSVDVLERTLQTLIGARVAADSGNRRESGKQRRADIGRTDPRQRTASRLLDFRKFLRYSFMA